jgi:hypothetical protein
VRFRRQRVDGFSDTTVLLSEPAICQVDINASGPDRAVPGLSLQRLQRYAGFAQPCQAGVAELMARESWQPSTLTGTLDDLIQTSQCEWLTAAP